MNINDRDISGTISARKDHHLDLVLGGSMAMTRGAGFDAIAFEHVALPELDYAAIDIATGMFGRRLAMPFLISSMTGGAERAKDINETLAEAAQALGIAFAVGSQRVAIDGGSASGFTRALRDKAPDVPILANFGAAQLNLGYGLNEARRAVDMIGADALILHLNPLQEVLQPEGNRNWSGVLAQIGALADQLDVPLVVKEVGSGISASVARRLVDAGVHFIDVAGAGGTSWAKIEGARSPDPIVRAAAETFSDWGIPTAVALRDVRAAVPEATIIASGGIKTGLDAAKAIRLGASLCGLAAGTLREAIVSVDAVVARFRLLETELRMACFCTGSATLAALASAKLSSSAA